MASGYRERFSIGLLTASGSLGLLFPLSLPLMLYGIVSQKASIEDLFIGGLLPGLLMLALLASLGVREGIRTDAERTPFRISEALSALWEAKWELHAARLRRRSVHRRRGHARRVGADRGALHGDRAAIRQPGPAVVEGRLPRGRRLHRTGRRRPADPGGRCRR